MLLDPSAERIIIIGGHGQHEDVNPLDLLLDLDGVFIDDLPSKCEGDQYRYHGYSREDEHYMRQHLTEHGADAILRVVVVMDAFHRAVGDHHVERSEGEIQWRILLFESVSIFNIFPVVEHGQYHEANPQNCIQSCQMVLVLTEMASSIENL